MQNLSIVGSLAFSIPFCSLSACGAGGSGDTTPTPNNPLPVAATPTFSVAEGSYFTAQSVALATTTTGASIYYTTDRSAPSSSSTKYTSPIQVASSLTIKAVAAASGYTSSAVASESLTIESISNGNPNGLADLPLLSSSGVPQPTGAQGGLKVLSWAGFTSAVTYTFDDSLASQLAVYPQLHATGARMTYFQISGSGVNAGWQQVLDDGNELGNHTAHHCYSNGTGCGVGTWAGSAAAEYELCNTFLMQSYGVGAVWDTATPYGDTGYDATAANMFVMNRGVWNGQIAPNDSTDPYNLLSYGVPSGNTASDFDALIDAAHSSGKWQIFLFHGLDSSSGINPADLISSVRYAQAYGDLWVDDLVNVGSYWLGQKAVANAVTTQSGNDLVVSWKLPSHYPPGRHLRVTVTGGTVKQGGVAVPWNSAGYYEISLDADSLTIAP